jgi:hypothetical protein
MWRSAPRVRLVRSRTRSHSLCRGAAAATSGRSADRAESGCRRAGREDPDGWPTPPGSGRDVVPGPPGVVGSLPSCAGLSDTVVIRRACPGRHPRTALCPGRGPSRHRGMWCTVPRTRQRVPAVGPARLQRPGGVAIRSGPVEGGAHEVRGGIGPGAFGRRRRGRRVPARLAAQPQPGPGTAGPPDATDPQDRDCLPL